MAGLFSRLKLWEQGESITSDDLNAEFNNILANVDSEHAEGYSSNLAEMQMTQDPGGVGTEKLAQPISTAQEIERLRYTISRIIGKSYWYDSPSSSLQSLQNNLSQAFSISPNRIISGKKSLNSSQPVFLQARGAAGVALTASVSSPFSAYIDNNLITLTSDVTLTGLSAAPTTGNTATLMDTFYTVQFSKGVQAFNLSTPGAEITARLGKLSAFKINNGSSTEYFVGTVVNGSYITYSNGSGTTTPTITPVTKIVGIQRGAAFDNTQVASTPIALTNGHTITVLRLAYIFLKSNSTLDVSYNAPFTQTTAPTGASIGDYWFDMTLSTWKRYDGSTWSAANAILLGYCAQDGANCMMARSADVYAQYSEVNQINVELLSSTVASTQYVSHETMIAVYGSMISKKYNTFTWDITSQLPVGETEQPNTLYYLYVKEGGDTLITSQKPLYMRERQGFYHPWETWRAVGSVFNGSTSDLTSITLESFGTTYGKYAGEYSDAWDVWPAATVGELKNHVAALKPNNHVLANGAAFSISQLPRLWMVEGVVTGAPSNGLFFVADLRGVFVRGTNGGSGRDPNAATRTALLANGNVGDSVGTYEEDAFQGHIHATPYDISGGSNNQRVFAGQTTTAGSVNTGNPASDGANGAPRFGPETRPKNVQFNFIIRF